MAGEQRYASICDADKPGMTAESCYPAFNSRSRWMISVASRK